MDDDRWPGTVSEETRTTIILGEELPTKYVVFHNSLPHWREELVEFFVSSPHMKVTDFEGNPIQAQINPVWSWHKDTLTNTRTPQGSATKYRLMFKARVAPMGMVTYIIQAESANVKLTYVSIIFLFNKKLMII